MKAKPLYALLGVSLVLTTAWGLCALTDNDRDTIKQEVLRVHRQVVEAAQTGDAETMFSYILDNEGVILQNGIFQKNRQTALDFTKEGFVGVKKLDYHFDHEVVDVLSPDKALLKASGTSTMQTDDGRQFSSPFCETVIFTKTPDGWKILHAHQSVPVR